MQAHALASSPHATLAAAGVAQPQVQLTTAEAAATAAVAADKSNGTNAILPGFPDPASEEVTEWIRKNGGEVSRTSTAWTVHRL